MFLAPVFAAGAARLGAAMQRATPGSDGAGPSGGRVGRRGGRRPGGGRTQDEILVAARKVFAAHGYHRATMRAIAREANVDSALIHYFFGSKEGLFRAAIVDAFDPTARVDDALDGGSDGAGQRLVRGYLSRWSTAEGREPILAVLRSALSHEDAARMFAESVSERGIGPAVKGSDPPDAAFRAALVGSQLMGIVLLRYALGIEPLASADPEAIVASLGSAIDRYLTGELGPGSD